MTTRAEIAMYNETECKEVLALHGVTDTGFATVQRMRSMIVEIAFCDLSAAKGDES